MIVRRTVRLLDTLVEGVGRIVCWLVVPLTVLVTFEVVSRYVFNNPHIWGMHVFTWIMGTHFLLLGGYTLLHKRHIRMDVLYTRWSKKSRTVMDVVGHFVFFIPFVGATIWATAVAAGRSWETHEVTMSMTPLPVYVYKTVIPIGLLLLLIAGIAEIAKGIRYLVRGEEL